jgi:tetratricopeptide (TPR) repeat protein
MALAHAFLGRRARAMECFDRALALDPNYEPALVNRSMVTHMEEGQPLEPAVIGKARYYSDYRGKNGRRSYIQDILAALQKSISVDRHDDGQRAG